MQQKSDLPKKKLVTIGDAQAGKTSLLWRITHKQRPNIRDSTIGAAFFNSSSKRFCVNMWDTAGQERFRSMVPIYLRDAEIILFVYDIADRSSYEHLKKYWINFALTHSSPHVENVKKTPTVDNRSRSGDKNSDRNNDRNRDAFSVEPMRRSHTMPINITSSGRSSGPTNYANEFSSSPRNVNTFGASPLPSSVTSFGTTPPLRNSYTSGSVISMGSSPQTPSTLIRSNSTLTPTNSGRKVTTADTARNDSPTYKGRKNESPFCFIIANKSDLDKDRTVSTEEGINLAKSINAVFIELSALTGSNVDKIFNIIDSQLENDDFSDTETQSQGSTSQTIILDEQKGLVSRMFSCCN